MEQMHDRGKEQTHARLMELFPSLRRISNANKSYAAPLTRLQESDLFSKHRTGSAEPGSGDQSQDLEMGDASNLTAESFGYVLQGTDTPGSAL